MRVNISSTACAVAGMTLALAATSVPEAAARGQLTVGELATDCRAYVEYESGEAQALGERGALCAGYIQGFLSGYSYGSYYSPKKTICLPEGVTPGQLARMMVKANAAKPELEHQPAMILMIGIAITFQCAPSSPKESGGP